MKGSFLLDKSIAAAEECGKAPTGGRRVLRRARIAATDYTEFTEEGPEMTAVDLNADMGESFGAYVIGEDPSMLKIVSSANVACGFHGGDPLVMHETLSIAKANGVGVGAHPGFFDLWGFGRRPIHGERPADIEKSVVYQIGAIRTMAEVVGHPIRHVKGHGALANMAAVDDDLAEAIVSAIRQVDRDLIVVVMPGNAMERAAKRQGMRMAREVFADRAYDDDGNLVSRKIEGSVIHDADYAAERVLRMVEDQEIVSVSGKRIKAGVDTICVHGDNPAAVAMAGNIRKSLEGAGVTITPMHKLLA